MAQWEAELQPRDHGISGPNFLTLSSSLSSKWDQSAETSVGLPVLWPWGCVWEGLAIVRYWDSHSYPLVSLYCGDASYQIECGQLRADRVSTPQHSA